VTVGLAFPGGKWLTPDACPRTLAGVQDPDHGGSPVLDGITVGTALAVAWTLLVWFTHSPLRLAGWAVGGLIGIRLSRSASSWAGPSLGVLAVGLTAGTVLLAKLMMLVFALRPMVHDELMRNHTFTAGLFAAHMSADRSFSPELQVALDSAQLRPPSDPQRALELTQRMMAEARHRDSTVSRAQREVLVRAYEDSLMARKGERSLPIFGRLLNIWDFLWVSLGVASAREMARRRVS
jgi:hypothetical protein